MLDTSQITFLLAVDCIFFRIPLFLLRKLDWDGNFVRWVFLEFWLYLYKTCYMQSIAFDQFVVQAGEDFSGVATNMLSMNSTLKFTFRNTATFFGVHVKPTPLDLSYSQLTVATGTVWNPNHFPINYIYNFFFSFLVIGFIWVLQIKGFYQSRKSQRSITITLIGNRIPVYGGGANLGSSNGAPTQAVPLTLRFLVRSKAYVLGKLVKPKFHRRVDCSVVMDPKKMNVAIALKNKCSYQWIIY